MAKNKLITRISLLFFISIIILLAFFSKKIDENFHAKKPLIISLSRWPGFMPLVVGVERGVFKKEGVDVEYRYCENIRQTLLEFSAEKYDGGCFKLGTVISGCALDRQLKIVMVTDFSAGADALVASPDINDFSDLRGRRVAFRFGSYAEVVVEMLFRGKKIKSSEATIMNWPDEDSAFELLTKGLVDALFIREPYVSRLVGKGFKVIASSADLPGLVPQVIVFRENVLNERPDDVKKFLKGWFASCELVKKEPAAAAEIVSKRLNLDASDLSFKGIELLDLDKNIKNFERTDSASQLHRCVKIYSDYFLNIGILKERLDEEKLVTDKFINDLK